MAARCKDIRSSVEVPYPDYAVKAPYTNFLQLHQNEISDCGELNWPPPRRLNFNSAYRKNYNVAVQSFPSNLIRRHVWVSYRKRCLM